MGLPLFLSGIYPRYVEGKQAFHFLAFVQTLIYIAWHSQYTQRPFQTQSPLNNSNKKIISESDMRTFRLRPTNCSLRVLLQLCVFLLFGFGTLVGQANPRGAFEYVSRAGNPDDGAVHLYLDGTTLFVANKFSGLQIMDVSDMSNPKILSRTPSAGQNFGLAKKDNYILMTDNLSGLIVYDVTNLKRPKKVAEMGTKKGEAWDIKIVGNYAYIAAGLAGLVVADVTDPKAPKFLTAFRVDRDWDFARNVFVGSNNRLYVADRKSGIHILDITNPAAPVELKRYLTQFASAIHVEGQYAYVADGPGGLLVLDVSNQDKIRLVGEVKLPGYANDLLKAGNYIYIALDDVGIRAIDVTDPTNPIFDSRYDTPGQAFSIIKQDIFILVADLSSVLVMIHNKPPVIIPTGSKTVAENQKLEFKVRGYDPDGNPILFSGNFIPEGAVFSPQDTMFTWTPSFEQSGKYDGIVFTVTENTKTKLFSRDTISITVTHTNRAPSLPLTGNFTADENVALAFAINPPTDPDVEDDGQLTVSASNLPAGSTFDPTGLTFKWIPTYDQSGTYTVTFTVKDPAGASESKASVITVNHINRPPVLADLPSTHTVDENKTLTIKIGASDPDKEDAGKLEFGGFGIPPGASFDRVTQTFTWTPTYEQSGEYTGVFFVVRDPDGLSDTVTTSVSVRHVNRPPVLALIPAQVVDEEKPLSYKVSVSDPDVEDEGRLTVKASGLSEGALFDETTLTLNWKPTYEQSGDHPFVYTVSDPSGLTDQLTVPVKVMNINRPPVIAAIESVVGDENKEIVVVAPEGQDPDKEDIGKLTYTADGLPQGATFDAATRTIKWLPTYDQSGVYEGVKVTVKDLLGLTATSVFKMTVNHVNRPPVLDAVAEKVVDETKPLTFVINGHDPDKEDAGKLAFFAEGLPEGAVFDPATRTFTWTPTFDQAGKFQVTVGVEDPSKLSDKKVVSLAVNNVNRLPKLAPIAAMTGDENKEVTIQVAEAEDPDKEDIGKLTYKADGLPQGAVFDAASRTIRWTPTYEQSGAYSIKVTVTDVLGGADTKTVDVRINHVNRPPVIADPGPQNVDEGQKLSLNINISDPDKEDNGKLVLKADGVPQGAVFNAVGKSITWTPTFEQAGEYQITLTVNDAAGLSDSKTVVVTVKNTNRKPALGAILNQQGTEGKELTFALTATDPDKEDAGKLTFSAEGLPSGAGLSKDGKFSWTPGFDQSGDHSLTLKVKDEGGLEDSKTITIKVANVNRAPRLSDIGAQSTDEGNALAFSVSASDDDKQDKLTFTMTGAPAGASLSSGGDFSWTPAVGQAGNYTVTIKVSDGTASDTKTVTITVNKAAP